MIKPKISIIIPVYNVEKYLKRCLDSVLKQTFTDWEAICVNDGSTDSSGKILAEYATCDKRFKIINKKNGGVSRARNDGIKKSSGKYIMFLDSDDCIHPQTMELVYNFALDNNADLVSFRVDNDLYKQILKGADTAEKLQECYLRNYKLNKIKYKKTDCLINYATERNHSFGRFKVRHCYPVVHLYKRDLLQGIEFNHNIKICEDFPFFTSVLLHDPKTVILNLPLYFYLPNTDSALKSSDAKKLFDNVSLAIMYAFNSVSNSGQTTKWVRVWNKEFLWPFIITLIRASRNLANRYVKKQLVKMTKVGVFDNPPTMRARKYKHRIEKIIHPIS